MEYTSTHLKKVFVINEIITVHYLEYEKDYEYIGEKHDFWELVYVDKGEIIIDVEDEQFKLEQGNIAFHQPNEFHNLHANGIVAPNIVIVTFKCKSPAMNFFKKRIMPLSDIEKGFLSVVIKESINSFSSPLEDTFLTQLTRRDETYFGAEQMISLSLEQLLISLYRNFGKLQKNTTTLKRGIHQDVVNNILQYMNDHFCEKITLDEIATAINISKSGMSTIFKNRMGESVMNYFSKMKIDISKTMIREGKYNISQISSYLGFDSIHLFSRTFKRITGMTPIEYGKSIKVDFENINYTIPLTK